MSDTSRIDQQLPSEARQRMTRWLASPGLRSHLENALDMGRRPLRTGPYIAISRQAGTGGTEVAQLIAKRLGWDILDKEILDFMAEYYGMPRAMLEFVDETRASWLQDFLSSWLDTHQVSHEKFVVYLERIIFLAAIYGSVVFVGRGAHCILPLSSGLSVRLVAPLEYRIARQMHRLHVSRQEAKRQLTRVDTERDDFHRRFFHHDVKRPCAFDLTINTACFSEQDTAELIVEAFERAELETAPTITSADA